MVNYAVMSQILIVNVGVVAIFVAHQKTENNQGCYIPTLLGIFLETNKHQKLIRPKCPICVNLFAEMSYVDDNVMLFGVLCSDSQKSSQAKF